MTRPSTAGIRPPAIRTFVIADIRGYTSFTAEKGDEAASRLAAKFEEVATQGVEAWGGELIEVRGDEALAVFDSARQAVRASLELQAAFAAETLAESGLPLRVGIGLDAGEAVALGDGYRGAALNRASRLCGIAGAGEAIASESVAYLAGTIPGISYVELKPTELKGLMKPVPAVRLADERAQPVEEHGAAAGRRTGIAAIGPPRTAPVLPLPPELDPIVPIAGRLAELRWLGWHWRRAGHGAGRTLVISGPPGMGKTRLAAELARRVHVDGAGVSYLPAGRGVETVDGVQSTSSPAPTLIIVDDFDAATPADRKAVVELASGLDGSQTLLLVTHRLEAATGLLRLVERLGPTEQRRRLEPLELDEVRAISALYAGRAVDTLPLARLLEESAGLPAAIHRLASAWGRSWAEERLSASVKTTSVGRRGLRMSETELIESVTDLELARERTELYGAAADADSIAARVDVCPYKGLAAFETADADYFFGRERLVAELVARLVGTSFLGVLGASGAGKSSAIRAGLLPALAGGVLPGSQRWLQIFMRPGEHPMAELRRAVGRATTGRSPSSSNAVEALDGALASLPADARLVLVVDQFEEVFNATRDEEERTAFVDLLTSERDGLAVIVAMRADHYGHCAAHSDLAAALGSNQVLVGPLTRPELEAVIEHPAQRVGLRVEPGLTEALLDDVGDEPGALPLLSTALLELWQARRDRSLTMAAYNASGGVRGAVARMAEAAYGQLEETEQRIARSVLLRLAGPGEGEGVVRRRVMLSELDVQDDPAITAVLDKLTGARLLTTGDGYVEVAHEALLREWPRLQAWLAEDAAGRQLRLHLIGAARDWHARGREAGDLYRGARLAAALDWSPTHEHELNALERDFLEESRLASEREVERQRRTNRRLRLLLAGAGVFLIVAVAAGIYAAHQAQLAGTAEEFARSRELAASAIAALDEDPALSKLLALSAASIAEPPIESVSALHEAWAADRVVYRYEQPADKPVGQLYTDLDATGRLLAATGWWFGAPHGYVEVVDIEADAVLWSFEPKDETTAVGHAFFTPDGERVVFGLYREQARAQDTATDVGELGVHVRDARTGEAIGYWPTGDCGAAVAAVSETNVLVRTSSSDSCIDWGQANEARNVGLEVVDLASGGRTLLTTGALSSDDGALSRDGRWVSYDELVDPVMPAPPFDSTPMVVDLITLARSPIAFSGCCVRDVNNDGSLVLIGEIDGDSLQLWDVRAGEMRDASIRGNNGGTYYAEFAPDGQTIFSTGPDAMLRQWSLDGDELRTVPGIVNARPAISDTGLVLVAPQGTTSALLVDTRLRAELGAATPRLDFSSADPDTPCFPDAGRLQSAGSYAVFIEACGSGPVPERAISHLIDTETNQTIRSFDGFVPVLAPDGSRLAFQVSTRQGSALAFGSIRIVDAMTGQNPVELEGLCTYALTDEQRPQCRVFPNTPFAAGVWQMRWSADGAMIALADGNDGFIGVWNARDGTLTADSATGSFLDAGIGAFDIVFTPDSSRLIVSARRGADEWYLRSILTDTWTVERTRDITGSALRLTFVGHSADGSTLFAASGLTGLGGAALYSLDVATLEDTRPSRPRLHDGELYAAALSEDRFLMATGASDGSVRVWATATGTLDHETRFNGEEVFGVAFVDTRRLGVVLGDGSYRVITIDSAELIDIVGQSLTRGFTAPECERFNFEECPKLEEMRSY